MEVLAKYPGKCRRCGMRFSKGAAIYCDDGYWYPVDCEGCRKMEIDLEYLVPWAGIVHPKEGAFTITCAYEFEPHGRATEDFELTWKLEFAHETDLLARCPDLHWYDLRTEFKTLDKLLTHLSAILIKLTEQRKKTETAIDESEENKQ